MCNTMKNKEIKLRVIGLDALQQGTPSEVVTSRSKFELNLSRSF